MTSTIVHLPRRRILLAEDDPSMRFFLESLLARAGYEVIAYNNGAEAYARLQTETFTLLLTDISMPAMDGIELARRASALDPALKIMFITGFAVVVLMSGEGRPHDRHVLSKPIHLRNLVSEVDRLLAA